MRRKTGKLRAGEEVTKPQQSLAYQTFDMHVRTALQQWATELPPAFNQEDFANLLDQYLDLAYTSVKVRFRKREARIPAAAIAAKFEAFDDTELWSQEDFHHSVLPLLTQSDFQNIGCQMDKLRERAQQLHLGKSETKLIIRNNIARLRKDERPYKVQQGEILVTVIQELKRIKDVIIGSEKITCFQDLAIAFPHFYVVKLVRGRTFSQDDREYLANPAEWKTRPESYARAILKNVWGEKSAEAFKSYHKALNRWNRTHPSP